jgi:hypothetical protein
MKKPKTLTAWFRRSGAQKWATRHRFTEPEFEPYAKSIGQLLLAWNDLHERLATLFTLAMGGGWVDRYLAIWHGTRSDHSKRQLLAAAISKLPDGEKSNRDKLVEEINWILQKTNRLEGFRDDSAHTPLRFRYGNFLAIADLLAITDIYRAGLGVTPDTTRQNPRAIRIDDKTADLLVEQRYARERIIVLRDYIIAIDAAWGNARLPWPDRPDLPERKPSRRSKGSASRQKRK